MKVGGKGHSWNTDELPPNFRILFNLPSTATYPSHLNFIPSVPSPALPPHHGCTLKHTWTLTQSTVPLSRPLTGIATGPPVTPSEQMQRPPTTLEHDKADIMQPRWVLGKMGSWLSHLPAL